MTSARGALMRTAFLIGCLGTPAYAVDVAGTLLVDLDPVDFNTVDGFWPQHSLTGIQGSFTKQANATPQLQTVGGAQAVVLDGDGDYLTGPNTISSLTAAGAPHSVEYWAFQGQIRPEEAVLSWSRREGPDGTFAGFRYATNAAFGAAARWGPPDMGFAAGPSFPNAGAWHHIVITYDGSAATNTQRIYVDGVLNASEVTAPTLDAKDGFPIYIGTERLNNGNDAGRFFQYSGALGKVRIHSGALTDAQVLNNYNLELASYPGVSTATLPRPPVTRFSFNEAAGAAAAGSIVTDSIGGLTGVIRGTGATFTGTGVQLPGGAAATAPAYIDLPNGLISSKQQVSIELWSTQTTNQTWSRLMAFGTSTIGEVTTAGNTPAFNGDEGLVVYSNVNNAGDYRLERVGGTVPNGAVNRQSEGATVLNTELHHVIVYDPSFKEWRIYRNGYLMETLPENQGPSSIEDVNNWLGRSNFGADNGFAGIFNEFRVYNYMLTESQIRGNTLAGPTVLNLGGTLTTGTWVPTAAGTFSYNTAANWNPAAVPNGTGTFANIVSDLAGDEIVQLNAPITVGTLSLGDTNGSNKFTLAAGTGGTLTMNAGVGYFASINQTSTSLGDEISAPVSLVSDTEISNLGAAPMTLSGQFSGTGKFLKGGSGTILLTGDNSAYAGGVALNGGILSVGNGGTTGFLGSGPITSTDEGTLVINHSNPTTFSQTFTGDGTFAQNGTGEVTVTGTINLTGPGAIKSGSSLVNNSSITVRNINVNGKLVMTQPGSVLNATQDFNVGDLEAGPSSFQFDNGTLNTQAIFAGKNVNTSGVIVQTGGTVNELAGRGDSRIGGTNAAAFASWGAYRMTGGVLNVVDNFQIGGFGVGIMEVDGGIVNFNGGFPVVARFQDGVNSDSYGLLDVRAGSVSQTTTGQRLFIAEAGYGTLNVRGTGLVSCTGGLLVGGDNGGPGHGTVNLLTGGVIETQFVDQNNSGTADGAFNFNGGVLRAKGNSATFFGNLDRALIYSGGATINSNGFTVTASQAFGDPTGSGVTTVPVTNGGSGYLAPPFIEITGGGGTGATAIANITGGVITSITVTNPGIDYTSAPSVNVKGGGAGTGLVVGTPTIAANVRGNFTKTGSGTLVTTGASTYTGSTTVAEGTMQIDGFNTAATGVVTVSAGATLSGLGSVNDVTVNGTLAPGSPTGAFNAQNVTFNPGSKLSIRIDDTLGSTNGSLEVVGTLNIAGATLDATVVGAATMFPYTIANATNITGNFAAVAPGIQFVKTATTITITAAGTPYTTWAASKGLTGANNGPTQDPEFDGITNLLEFILGGNPLASDPSILPVQTLTATDFVFTFSRADESESETTQKFQYGSTLTGWTDIAIGAVSSAGVAITENGASPDTVVVTIPRTSAVGGKLFGRLNAVK